MADHESPSTTPTTTTVRSIYIRSSFLPLSDSSSSSEGEDDAFEIEEPDSRQGREGRSDGERDQLLGEDDRDGEVSEEEVEVGPSYRITPEIYYPKRRLPAGHKLFTIKEGLRPVMSDPTSLMGYVKVIILKWDYFTV